ncbi:hypothetical protein J7M22_17815 [Candidatus Poribacteria bacterium]|nr:hypothetical protein [Candidatus Poribacteria bacterium]
MKTLTTSVIFLMFLTLMANGADIGLLFDKLGKTGRALEAIGVSYDNLEHDVSKLSNYKLIMLGHNGAERDEPHGKNTEYAEPLQGYVANGGFILQMFHWCENPATWDWMPIPLKGTVNNLTGPSIAVDPDHPIFNIPNKVPRKYENNCWGAMDSGWGSFTEPFVDALLVGDEYKVLLAKEGFESAAFIVEAKYKKGGYMLVQGLMDVACASPLNSEKEKEEAKKLFENIVRYCLGFAAPVSPSGELATCWGKIKAGVID